ncbi:MAG: HIRAN domain-containing protein [Peptococcaceae bacterium]|nr:HIRAN domain-containing protein [Peptococcaceae bacterium]
MYERSRNLLDCHISGFNYYDGLDVVESLKHGTYVTLVSESDNPYDPEAIAVYFKEIKLGYIPHTKNSLISNLLYFGYGNIIEAKINSCDPQAHPERQFRIVVRIKDSRKQQPMPL